VIDDGRVVANGTPSAIKAALVDEYLLVDADDRPTLLVELSRLALPYSGAGPFRIQLDGRRTHQVLRAIETPLSVVRTHTPSLEDAYLEIVDKPRA
jgi:ABC-2 type transport system ATP-binding protein